MANFPEASYRPTQEDLLRIRQRVDKLKVSGDGVFATLQGEGVTAGKPAVFLRLQLCNLACGKNGGWKCDTGYTWDRDREEYWKEPEDWGYKETAQRIEEAWSGKFGNLDARRVVITGGEPMLQQGKIAELLEDLPGWSVEIETNGTIVPLPALSDCQINCSPKLSNSGNERRKRYKPEVLKHINSLPNSWFKFVVTGTQGFEEIETIVEECGIDSKKILIMPEGQTTQEVEHHAEMVRDEALRRDLKLINRNQFIWFGPKRKT